MPKEIAVLQSVKNYLINLGYSEIQIRSNIRIDQSQDTDYSIYGKVLDLVVYRDNNAWIVIEVKSHLKMVDAKEWKYNPYVRQLQSYARAIHAPYYLLTDGINYFWFSTDLSGRPQFIPNPILPCNSKYEITANKRELTQIFREFKYTLSQNKVSINANYEAATIILAKLLKEIGNDYLEKNLYNIENNLFQDDILDLLKLDTQKLFMFDKEVINECFKILNYISFRDLDSRDILTVIDEEFLKGYFNKEYRISRWLADFLVRLSNINLNSTVLDISSSFGEIPAAVMLSNIENRPSSLYAISHSIEGALWSKIQQIILGNRIDNIIFENYIDDKVLIKNNIPKPTNIITALSFGMQNQNYTKNELSIRLNKFEDILLQLATKFIKENGRIVVLVPESLLFEGGQRKYFREYLLDRLFIRAIISMPSGALLPFSSVKSSILVIDKVQSTHENKTFVAIVNEFGQKDIFDSRDIPEINNILDQFNNYSINEKNTLQNRNLCTVPINVLDNKNLSASNYLMKNMIDKNESPYLMMPLKEICYEIIRGKSIKLNEIGDINVLGPASIRPLEIDKDNISKTLFDKIGTNPINIKLGDIVINNIGTYLGAAALIEENIKDTYISQHVILIRPNTTLILPDFLAIAFNSKYVKDQIIQMATGSVMPSISISSLNKIKIPVPEYEMQKVIIENIKKSKDEIQQIKKDLRLAEEKYDKIVARLRTEEEI